MTGKTLAELNVKPGDVVQWKNGAKYILAKNKKGKWCDEEDMELLVADCPHWSIVSRATPDAPVMTLPDGTILREGDYAKLRNGEVVGVLERKPWGVWLLDGWDYDNDGSLTGYSTHDLDIIAKATYPRTAKAVAQLDANTMATVFGYTLRELHDIVAEHERRIKPEPTRETVALYVNPPPHDMGLRKIGTIVYEDGKPDPASIKMNEVE